MAKTITRGTFALHLTSLFAMQGNYDSQRQEPFISIHSER